MSNTIGSQIRITFILVVAALTLTAWLLTYYQSRQMGLLMQAGVPMSLGMQGMPTRQVVASIAGGVFITLGAIVVVWPVLLLRLS